MKFYNLDNWDANFRHDGLLYFTQRIQEMLFYYSAHIYKTPVLNTYLLVREYLNVAELVKNKTINENHLKHIMDEFQDAFGNDLIIRENIEEERRKDILQRLNSATIDDQEKIMKYLLNTLGEYNVWCINYLKKVVPQEKEKKKIERALRCFIPGIIGAGYSREFVFYYNRAVFSSSSVSSLATLDQFLNRFDFKKRVYSVYLAIDKQAFFFREILEKHIGVIFKAETNAEDLKYDREKYDVITLQVEALDERTASNKAYESLSLFFRYYNFLGDQKADWLFNIAKVVDKNNQVAFVELHSEGFDYSSYAEKEKVGEATVNLISLLLANDRGSFTTIDRAIKMHNVAIAEKDIRNGFLNLWSVFEILFVSDQTESISGEIEKKVLPVLKKNYLHCWVEEIRKNLKDNLPQALIDNIINKVGGEENDEWVCRLLFLPQYEDCRTEVYGHLKNHALMRSRISQINRDFSDKKSIQTDMKRFEKRVRWHLKRLYRTRNSIIHAGNSPDNLKELGEHLHGYVDECLLAIIFLLVSNHQLRTIDNVGIDIQLKDDMIESCLRENGKIDEAALSILFK